MAKVEVDESDFLASQATIRAVNGMLANPEARKLLLQARKKADPSVAIPEIDAAAPIQSSVDAFKTEMAAALAAEREARAADLKSEREALAAMRAEREAEKEAAKQAALIADFQNNWNRQKAQLRADGWRDEGIEAIEKHAQERGIADLEIAAAHWEKLHPPAEPVTPNGSGSWGFMEGNDENDKFVKAMIESRGEDEAALQTEINAALKDFRSQQTQGWRR